MSSNKSKSGNGMTESDKVIKAFYQIFKAQTAKTIIVDESKDKTDSRLAEPGVGQAVSTENMTMLLVDSIDHLHKVQKGYKQKCFPDDAEHQRDGRELLDPSTRLGEPLAHIIVWQQYESYWVEYLMKAIFKPGSTMYKFYDEAVKAHHQAGISPMMCSVWTYVIGRAYEEIKRGSIHKSAEALESTFDSVIENQSTGSLKDKLDTGVQLTYNSTQDPQPVGQVIVVAMLNALDSAAISRSSPMYNAINSAVSEPQQEAQEHQRPFEDRTHFAMALSHFSSIMQGDAIILFSDWDRKGSLSHGSGGGTSSSMKTSIFNCSKAIAKVEDSNTKAGKGANNACAHYRTLSKDDSDMEPPLLCPESKDNGEASQLCAKCLDDNELMTFQSRPRHRDLKELIVTQQAVTGPNSYKSQLASHVKREEKPSAGTTKMFSDAVKIGSKIAIFHRMSCEHALNRIIMARVTSDRFAPNEDCYGGLDVKTFLGLVSQADKRDRALEGRGKVAPSDKEVSVNYVEIQTLKRQRASHQKEMEAQAESRSKASGKGGKGSGKGGAKATNVNNVSTDALACYFCNSDDHQIIDCPDKKTPLTGDMDDKAYRHPKHGNMRSICTLCLHAGLLNSDGSHPHHQPIRGEFCPMNEPQHKDRLKAAMAVQPETAFWDRIRKDLLKGKGKEISANNTGVSKKKRKNKSRAEKKANKAKKIAKDEKAAGADEGTSVAVNATLALTDQSTSTAQAAIIEDLQKKLLAVKETVEQTIDEGDRADFVKLCDINHKKAGSKSFFESA